MGGSRPFALTLYAALTRLLGGVAYRRVCTKLRLHGTDPARFRERLGEATLPRPEGRLVWFHAASVGESLSVLALITHMGRVDPGLNFLITSGTATSAEVLTRRLPPRTRHQFAPLDTRTAMGRFLDHWRPDAGVFVESELWPHMIERTRARGIPLALINARISLRSARNWQRFARTARHVMGQFTLIHCQDEATARVLQGLGLPHAEAGGNLKSASGPAPVEASTLTAMQEAVGDRPVWVAASTHPGEEEAVLKAHRAALGAQPDLLLVLVPRHPERAQEVAALMTDLRVARRSANEPLGTDTQVYLADTMGETGLWYALGGIVFLGGSLVPVGGHNPFEPAHAGVALIHGPLYDNFSGADAALHKAGASREVADAAVLTATLAELLKFPGTSRDLQRRAAEFARAQTDLLEGVSERLFAALLSG